MKTSISRQLDTPVNYIRWWWCIRLNKQQRFMIAGFLFMTVSLLLTIGFKLGEYSGFGRGWNKGYDRGLENAQNTTAWQEGFSACQEQF